ncbi:hypothetical protein MAR_020801, partial [Mya arenaria]
GAALSYPCLFIPGNPSETSIVWTSSVDHRQWNSQIVSISSVQRSDDGMYTCTATNKMAPTGSPIQIGIHNESLISDFHLTEHIGTVTVTKSEYSDATFTCTVDSNPLSTLKIRKEDEIRRSVENSKQLEYTIVNLTCWDAGLYTCDGSNKFNNNTPSTKDLRLFVHQGALLAGISIRTLQPDYMTKQHCNTQSLHTQSLVRHSLCGRDVQAVQNVPIYQIPPEKLKLQQ